MQYISMALQPLWTLAAFFNFLISYTIGRTPWTEDQPVARPLPTHRTTQAQNKRTQTFIPRVGLEPTIPVFERANTGHALDRAATAIGTYTIYLSKIAAHASTQLPVILLSGQYVDRYLYRFNLSACTTDPYVQTIYPLKLFCLR
jgi:hypothetical protein